MMEILKKGYMEFSSIIRNSRLEIPHDVLLRATEDSQIHTFGWPIGLVLQRDDARPRPYADGIKATIYLKRGSMEETYDYWNLGCNGDYYILKSLFEDCRAENKLFFDTRTVRITETFLRTALLYRKLGISQGQAVEMNIKHGGLKGRELSAANPARHLMDSKKCNEDIVESKHSVTLRDIEENTEELVFEVVRKIMMMFEFQEIPQQVIADIVRNFRLGRVS